MGKKPTPLLYISLALGIVFILLGLVLLIVFFAEPEELVFSRSALGLLVFGAVFIYVSIAVNHRAFFLYVGLNLCFFGMLALVLTFNIFRLSLGQIWPLGMVFCGISLIPAGYYRFRRLQTVYIFPSFVLILLGIFFGLFSFDILSVSFSSFVSVWWPTVFIILGIVLIGIFQYQRNNRFSFPYMTGDETDDDETGEES
ncbi:hypothetical protein [Treponema parvum]|uniref:hypothetical protein n=1 Tax=Treponema parvum TaxID=138851 RepID=UPI001AEC7126|nr:hypothetical protein [Treponema parvum]QTQ16942.1 hypothetical protein HXT04_09700 [Treponema parvum]